MSDPQFVTRFTSLVVYIFVKTSLQRPAGCDKTYATRDFYFSVVTYCVRSVYNIKTVTLRVYSPRWFAESSDKEQTIIPHPSTFIYIFFFF